MYHKKRISFLLAFLLIFSSLSSFEVLHAQATPYYGIDISSGHSSPFDIIFSDDNKLYVSEYSGSKILQMDKTGSNKNVFFSSTIQPLGMTFDNAGNLYIAEHSNRKVKKIDPSGNSSILLDTGVLLTGIAIDSQDKLFVLDYQNGNIIKMNSDGTGNEIFASGFSSHSIIGLTIDSNDNLYVSSRNSQSVFKVTPDGTKTEFITNTGFINEVKVGKDGFLYVPNSNTRTIDKYDLNGSKLDSFNANSSDVWAIAVDTDGSIYYSDSSSIKRLIGSANTIDTTHIKIKLNKTMVSGAADPNAFTLSGASSNPQIIEALVADNEITLTLDAKLTSFDTNLILSYNQTGIDDLTVAETSLKFSDFANMPVANYILRVMNVANIPQINVENGTPLNQVPLPTIVTLNISDYSSTTSAAISWDNGTPVYSPTQAGTYAFTGTFAIADPNISNPNDLKAHVNVAVGEVPTPNIDSISPLSDISVSKGTLATSINFPSTVNVNLSNSTTTSAAISWNTNTPDYKSDTPGTYYFTGSIEPSAEFLNPGNLMAGINVIVKPAPSKGGSSSSDTSTPKNTVIKINNESFNIGNEQIHTQNGIRTVDISVLTDSVTKIIDERIKDSQNTELQADNTIEIIVPDRSAANSNISLTGDIVKKLEHNNFNILISREGISYNIPASMLDVDSIAQQMTLDTDELQKIEFDIQINKAPKENQLLMHEKTKEKNAKILIEPLEFKIYASSENNSFPQKIEVNRFTNYVERVLQAPKDSLAEDISTGIVFNADYTYNPVPTALFTKDNQLYIRISALTNSTYSVINNPVSVSLPENHWAQATVENMASRLILPDPKNFDPDKPITRAELVEYLTRSLGIYRADTSTESMFTDIDKENPHFAAIVIANNWNIINGYPDSTFRPDALVTREEAMIMYANIMDVANYTNPYEDSASMDTSDIAKWALPSAIKVTNARIFTGRNATTLDPKENLTHAEALAAIEKFLHSANLITEH
ncbi:S-layer homology domain-containing protein [Vallitaleaceae bacterium 9-2]